MILLDGPYISDFLLDSIEQYNLAVIATPNAVKAAGARKFVFVSEHEAIEMVRNGFNKLYTNSENSISWIEQNLRFSNLPGKIKLFKDKYEFRKLIENLYPDFFFKTVSVADLDIINIESIPKPFVIKPAIGFFSMGVHKVDHASEWPTVKKAIKDDLENVKNLYPAEVLNTSKLLIEEIIQGEEFAIDCYFNETGKPIILNILHHVFSSGKDVSDRVYSTSKNIIKKYYKPVEDFLNQIGAVADLKHFPCHVEIRIDESGKLIPVEINPLRFGGWCTTADFTWFSYAFNSYEYFINQKIPDWESILETKGDEIYSIIVLDNNSGIKGNLISEFNYEKLFKDFEKPLELRKTDYKKFPLFGFLFTETSQENQKELLNILHSDLKEFITTI